MSCDRLAAAEERLEAGLEFTRFGGHLILGGSA